MHRRIEKADGTVEFRHTDHIFRSKYEAEREYKIDEEDDNDTGEIERSKKDEQPTEQSAQYEDFHRSSIKDRTCSTPRQQQPTLNSNLESGHRYPKRNIVKPGRFGYDYTP